ncbi:YqjF family protein [Puniceicoccus vermicola]|uniref:DUF2071 domain-containing protein n=1 Tax=Puniceicoccus vermicola TaxID=388746 RepID=A0A7X1B0T6_9BACT|nr:DUF2071 domain-containing protein [Puniceicoccus vermicola]MBC2603369.1 DUF2071 domain-containing protein [Puniceicoccus vermicola]
MPQGRTEYIEKSSPVIMRQVWKDLLFLHWRFDPECIAATLPPGLKVETFDGSAWVGIVPFRMEKIRVFGIPLPPGLRAFPEINLRTYVRDEEGRSGVWFYSLDAADRLAVWGARTFFHLNYRFAHMEVTRVGEEIVYASRRDREPVEKTDRFRWKAPEVGLMEAREGSLEHFLLERYRLFSAKKQGNQLYTGTVSHEPYRYKEAEVSEWSAHLFSLNQFAPMTRPPDSCLASPGFPVAIHPLRRVR